MLATNDRQRRQLLAIGAVLCTIGSAGIVLPLIVGMPDVPDRLAFPTGFVVGMATGLGAALSLVNLRPR